MGHSTCPSQCPVTLSLGLQHIFAFCDLGVSSNPDFYSQLLDQFVAESYGDLLFSFFMVTPLTMNQPPSFRSASSNQT